MILSVLQSQLLVVDVQERLAPVMTEPGNLVQNVARLAGAAQQLGLPITVSEQYPKGLGATVPDVLAACGAAVTRLAKIDFSCGRDQGLRTHIETLAQTRKQLVICGIEAHVCVLQTALDFHDQGLAVAVVADAVDSRQTQSREIALRRLEQAGVSVVTIEMAMFEWLGRAGTPEFKALLPWIR